MTHDRMDTIIALVEIGAACAVVASLAGFVIAAALTVLGY
jgi:hypothetical protein